MSNRIPPTLNPAWTLSDGGVIRGDVSKKQLALIFTGGDFGEGTAHILDVLHRQHIPASFFVTGGFLRNPDLLPLVKRAISDGHYVGPHSDKHPLYCPWDNREKSLLTETEFRADLQKNIADLRAIGALKDPAKPVYFIPPYEWYNADQPTWARKMNVLLFNYTPGTGSNRDWAPETEKSFVPSARIIDDILRYETKAPQGLNGFLLLLHLGSARNDKPFLLLEPLLIELKARGYRFVRIDDLLWLDPTSAQSSYTLSDYSSRCHSERYPAKNLASSFRPDPSPSTAQDDRLSARDAIRIRIRASKNTDLPQSHGEHRAKTGGKHVSYSLFSLCPL